MHDQDPIQRRHQHVARREDFGIRTQNLRRQPGLISFSKQKYADRFPWEQQMDDGKDRRPRAEGTATYTMNYAFDFQYDLYPQDMILYVTSTFQEKHHSFHLNG